MAMYYSTGECYLCGGTFTRTGITRHLQACLSRQPFVEAPQLGPGVRQGRMLHLAIYQQYCSDYWMNLEVPATAELTDLDRFLRSIWLECCYHMSAFTIDGRKYYSSLEYGFFDTMGRGMNVSLGRLLVPGVKFYHEYDFGTTTELTLRVASEREDFTDGRSIRVLARNDAPEHLCQSCGNTATVICVQCIHEDSGWFCDECADQHGCGEDMFLPVVNSPRCGACGYSGSKSP